MHVCTYVRTYVYMYVCVYRILVNELSMFDIFLSERLSRVRPIMYMYMYFCGQVSIVKLFLYMYMVTFIA